MHDIRWIRENPKVFDRALARRNLSDDERAKFSSNQLVSIDERRRAIIRVREGVLARRNALSKEIGQAKAKKDEATFQRLMAQVEEDKASIARMEDEQKAVDKELNDLLAQIPNLPLDEVPDGKDEKDNVEHHHFGAKRDYAFAPKQHFDLGEALGQMDFETAAKLSGSRFVVLKKSLARLERALGQFMLDLHTSEPHNYTEVVPPLLVRDGVMFGTAQLPKFADDQYITSNSAIERLENLKAELNTVAAMAASVHAKIVHQERLRRRLLGFLNIAATAAIRHLKEVFASLTFRMRQIDEQIAVDAEKTSSVESGLWLIPTAEVSLTNLVRESIVDEAQLPLRYTACTPCFRAEAGAAGKDTRGMIRQHQFTKVELVSITTPEQSKDEHERMLACAEEVLKRLDLHYRVMILSAGDMGFASQKTYDIEVWLPGQNMYREISSCSICGEFQARRMNARYRTKEGRAVRHVHTLNGSGVAVGRALIAVMETYQQADGSIAVPDALQSYMGGMKKIEK
jgi:seryl-tRNA synthetase